MRFGPTVAEDFYREKSPPPKLPPMGAVLLQRVRPFAFLKITWQDESFVTIKWDGSREFRSKLKQAGMTDTERVDKVLGYVWEFSTAYFRIEGAETVPQALQDGNRRGVLKSQVDPFSGSGS